MQCRLHPCMQALCSAGGMQANNAAACRQTKCILHCIMTACIESACATTSILAYGRGFIGRWGHTFFKMPLGTREGDNNGTGTRYLAEGCWRCIFRCLHHGGYRLGFSARVPGNRSTAFGTVMFRIIKSRRRRWSRWRWRRVVRLPYLYEDKRTRR